MKVDGAKQLEVFRRHLRDHNLPVTHQREVVARVVFFASGHLSVDDIERELRDRGEHVGKATIYRTLDLLTRWGLVKEHDFREGFKRYEPATGRSHHEHLICLGCGKVQEFSHDRVERMVSLIAEDAGFREQHHRLEIYGMCGDCQRRDANSLMTTGHSEPER